jgi:hypothetical protein
MDKQTSFFGTMPFNPLVVLVTWLCIGVPQKIEEKRIYNPFRTKIHHGLIWSQNLTCLVLLETLWNKPISSKNSPWAYMESKFDMLGIAGNLVEYNPF